MTIKKNIILFLLPFCVLANASNTFGLKKEEKHKEIVTYKLDYTRVFPIDTFYNRGVTTVMFPGEIEGIAAGNVEMNEVHHNVDGTLGGDFIMAFQPGNYYFSIRALKSGASGAVNVIYGRNTYILKFKENEQYAQSTVNFSDEDGEAGNSSEHAFQVPSVAVLKGLLDKAKSFKVLKEKYPASVSSVEVCENKCISEYDKYTATIVKTWRFNNYNSLVFMVELKNNSTHSLFYQADKTALAVLGNKLYPALIDANGVMPPMSTTAAFFVVSSTADGRINKYAADNEWKVLINAGDSKK
jgi:hypothetical protein